MNYNQKLQVANIYLSDICGLCWEDLPDINSLHDAETEEDIIDLCKERLEDSGFPDELM